MSPRRAAFKLRELDARFALLKDARRILDLGAAPGGWTQVAVASCPRAHIVALDILPMEPVAGAAVLCADFLAENTETILIEALSGPADLVLSDMAPASTGHKATDALRTMALCEAALDFAEKVLRPGGHFVAKVMRGGTDHVLLARMRQVFAEVKHAKPPSSRAESSEWFVIAKGYRREDKAPLE
jgi:23S rRNA (uridine2552-2'-O)-methyltransferase